MATTLQFLRAFQSMLDAWIDADIDDPIEAMTSGTELRRYAMIHEDAASAAVFLHLTDGSAFHLAIVQVLP